MSKYKRTKYYSQQDIDECNEIKPSGDKFIDLEGKRFGKLKVLKFKGRNSPHSLWFCKCSCGNIVEKSTNQLNRGVDRCTDCAFKAISDKADLGQNVYYKRITLKFPYIKLIDAKDGKYKTKWVWYCPVCNTPFLSTPKRLIEGNLERCRCNTVGFKAWTQSLREFQIEDICKRKGLSFLGWKDSYTSNKSVLFVKCPVHPHYPISVNNFVTDTADYNCPHCADENRGKGKKFTLEKFIEDAISVHGDQFDYTNYKYVCSRTPSEVTCNVCGGKSKVSYDNHVNKGRGCSHCKGKNQKEMYLALACDNGTPVCLKYGIAVDSAKRVKEHCKNTGYDFEILKVNYYSESYMCKDSETFLKRRYGFDGFMHRDDFVAGFTETVSLKDMEDIVNMFEKLKEELT